MVHKDLSLPGRGESRFENTRQNIIGYMIDESVLRVDAFLASRVTRHRRPPRATLGGRKIRLED